MITFIISMLYILITLVLGIVISRKNKNIQEFLVAKDRLSLPLCCVLLMASTFAGAYTTGSVRDSYLTGFAPYLPIAAMGLGYATFVPLIRFYRSMSREGHVSIPEALSVRFDNRVKAAVLVINCLAYGATFAVQPVALASIVAPMLKLDPALVSWCAAALMAIMALTGLTGVAWMNTFHCLMMVGGMTVISIFAMNKAGGLANIVATVPAQTWNIVTPNLPTILIRVLALAVCMYVSSESATIAIGAKNVKTAKICCVVVGIVIFVFTALLLMIGVSAQILLPNLEHPSEALYLLSANLGPVFSIMASIAVLAAIMSSAPAYLLYFSTSITRQIATRFAHNASEKSMMFCSAICIVALAFFGNLFAQRATSILNFLFNVFEVMSITGLILIVGHYWKRVTGRSAFLSLVITTVIATLWMILGNPWGIATAWIVIVVGGALLILFTLMEKAPVSEGYARTRKMMDQYKNEA